MNSRKPLTKEDHQNLQSTVLCPNCARSILMCPCHVVPHPRLGMRALTEPQYLAYLEAQFTRKFGVCPEKVRPGTMTKEMRRALRKIETSQRRAARYASPRPKGAGNPG